jgi:hypothetical protein
VIALGTNDVGYRFALAGPNRPFAFQIIGRQTMAICIGLWIDHEKAVFATISNGREDIATLESKVGRHVRLSGGSRSRTPYGPQDIVSERRREEKHKRLLHQYYQKVMDRIREADKILIFGPGEAKAELQKEIAKSKDLSPKIVAVEPGDKMTDRQIMAKVRKFFQ